MTCDSAIQIIFRIAYHFYIQFLFSTPPDLHTETDLSFHLRLAAAFRHLPLRLISLVHPAEFSQYSTVLRSSLLPVNHSVIKILTLDQLNCLASGPRLALSEGRRGKCLFFFLSGCLAVGARAGGGRCHDVQECSFVGAIRPSQSDHLRPS